MKIRYRFSLASGESKEFAINLDYATLAMERPAHETYPEWTSLAYGRCSNCPLDATHTHCPIAQNLVDVVSFFKDRLSYEMADVEVEANNRTYRKKVRLQEGLRSLIGIFMVTSGCPVLDKLRPMVATHLPFMSSEESTYRMITMYLLAQYFLFKEGEPADWELKRLVDFLEEMRRSNAEFCGRLSSLGIKDASLNALATLNALGEITTLSILEDDLERWRRIFGRHYGKTAAPTA